MAHDSGIRRRGVKATSDYTVGYKKPPRSSRFIKGKSGNSKGRPAGSKNLGDLLHEALNEEVTISENGRRKVITKREAIAKQLVNGAASGDARSIKLLFELQRSSTGRVEASMQQTPLDEDDLVVMQDLIRQVKEVGDADDGGGDDDP
jgi:hypothetical protein